MQKPLKAKVFRYKRLPDVYGHIVYLTIDSMEIWPTNIPDLLPTTTSVEQFTSMNEQRGMQGQWKKQLELYEMVDVELTIL